MPNAITYFLQNYYTIGSQNYQAFYDFSISGSGIFITNITGNTSLTGLITGTNTGNFYQTSGVANFSGNSIYINNASGNINPSNCTYFLTYKNKASGDFTLVNCIETGAYSNSVYYKGYEFGVTANNHLYFNYYSPSGSQLFLSSYSLADTSNVFLSVEGGTISMGNYDFIANRLNSDSFPISSGYIFNPSGLWVSSNLQYTGLYSRNSKFKGTMSRFLAFSPSIPSSDLRLINSGTVYNYFTGGNVISYSSGTGITGYTTGQYAYFTGITGSTMVATGVITDVFGDQYSGYSQVDLTGTLYSQQVVPQYGLISTPSTGYVSDSVSLNTGILNSYGKTNVSFLFKICSGESVNFVYNTGLNTFLNQTNLYSHSSNFNYFTWINNNRSAYEVWANGLFQYSGQNITSGNIYNLTNIVSGDYVVDAAGNIYFSNTFGATDKVEVDIISPSLLKTLCIDTFSLTYPSLQSGSGIFYLNWPQNSEIFLNGQKLISGSGVGIGNTFDYGITGTGIYFANTGVFFNMPTGILSAIVSNNFCDDVSANNVMVARGSFLPTSSKAYRNGVRLDINTDYIELASFDTNLGSGIFDISPTVIYNGNGGFK